MESLLGGSLLPSRRSTVLTLGIFKSAGLLFWGKREKQEEEEEERRKSAEAFQSPVAPGPAEDRGVGTSLLCKL